MLLIGEGGYRFDWRAFFRLWFRRSFHQLENERIGMEPVWVLKLEDEKLSGHKKTAHEHGRLSLKWLPR